MDTRYKELSRPPLSALRQIQGGDLKGKTDINPQWRFEIMDSTFGQCGIGWKFEIVKLWDHPITDGTILCFAQINLYTANGDRWSDPVPGVGGNTLVDMVNIYDKNRQATGEKRANPNDEGYKMAITDALGTAMKVIGVAADIYRGNFDGSKYREDPAPKQKQADTPEIVALKQALIDYLNAGVFEHPENVEAVIAKNDMAGMKKALQVAKSKEANK